MNPSVFDGDRDGQYVIPANSPLGIRFPMPISKGYAREMNGDFVKTGRSQHSKEGNLVWVNVTHAIEQNIPYRVITHKNPLDGQVIGYEVLMMSFHCLICSRKLDQPEDPLSLDCGGDCLGCMNRIEKE